MGMCAPIMRRHMNTHMNHCKINVFNFIDFKHQEGSLVNLYIKTKIFTVKIIHCNYC